MTGLYISLMRGFHRGLEAARSLLFTIARLAASAWSAAVFFNAARHFGSPVDASLWAAFVGFAASAFVLGWLQIDLDEAAQ